MSDKMCIRKGTTDTQLEIMKTVFFLSFTRTTHKAVEYKLLIYEWTTISLHI
jgi:hypothetical protein